MNDLNIIFIVQERTGPCVLDSRQESLANTNVKRATALHV